MISIYEFSHRHLARTLFGADTPTNIRRIEALLSGESRMTVDIFWALSRLEPLMDINKSLRDLYERYEVADGRRNRKARETKNESGRVGGDDVARGTHSQGVGSDGPGRGASGDAVSEHRGG